MNKLSLLFLILLIVNNCSADKKEKIIEKEKYNVEKIEGTKTILSTQVEIENDKTILTKKKKKRARAKSNIKY